MLNYCLDIAVVYFDVSVIFENEDLITKYDLSYWFNIKGIRFPPDFLPPPSFYPATFYPSSFYPYDFLPPVYFYPLCYTVINYLSTSLRMLRIFAIFKNFCSFSPGYFILSSKTLRVIYYFESYSSRKSKIEIWTFLAITSKS